jgi:rsbT co-antagonist protein RsbR
MIMSDADLLSRRLERETRARKEAEALLEQKSRDLYVTNQELHQLVAAVAEKEARTHAILEAVVDGIITLDVHATIESCNPAAACLFGYPADVLIGQPLHSLIVTPTRAGPDAGHATEPSLHVLLSGGDWEMVARRQDGTTVPIEVTIRVLPLGQQPMYIGIVRDISERRRAEAEHQRLQDEIIRAQAAALAELSTPIIPLSDQVMVMPLIGALDSRRVQQVFDTLLNGLAMSQAAVAILDITGVPVVDTQVAHGLLRAAQAVKLLGAQVVLTGIRPEVAQTLVGLGIDMSGIITRSSLQSGIAYAFKGLTTPR